MRVQFKYDQKDMVDAAGSGHTVLMAFDPDPVNSTPAWQEIWRGDQDATLVKREGRPENVAQAVLFFVDNDFVTGVCLPVDGGRTVFAPDSV